MNYKPPPATFFLKSSVLLARENQPNNRCRSNENGLIRHESDKPMMMVERTVRPTSNQICSRFTTATATASRPTPTAIMPAVECPSGAPVVGICITVAAVGWLIGLVFNPTVRHPDVEAYSYSAIDGLCNRFEENTLHQSPCWMLHPPMRRFHCYCRHIPYSRLHLQFDHCS